MRMIFFIFCFINTFLFAQTVEVKPFDFSKLPLDEKICRRIINELAVDATVDSDVAYKDGEDVDEDGEKIPPAALEGSDKSDVMRSVTITLKSPLGNIAPPNLSTTNNLYAKEYIKGSEVRVGKLDIDLKTGGITWDNKPLSNGESAQVIQKCKQLLKEKDVSAKDTLSKKHHQS